MKAMESLTNKAQEHKGDLIYLTDEGRAVELPELRDALDMAQDIMFACQEDIEDFIEIQCGSGMYQGRFMLIKFGLEQAMSMIGKVTPIVESGAA